ncbi:MAG: hypothetical protein LBE09_06795 [Christensenellaceae bacterium]|nr:hypothetical protein [Christensenellaceae bacterium]
MTENRVAVATLIKFVECQISCKSLCSEINSNADFRNYLASIKLTTIKDLSYVVGDYDSMLEYLRSLDLVRNTERLKALCIITQHLLNIKADFRLSDEVLRDHKHGFMPLDTSESYKTTMFNQEMIKRGREPLGYDGHPVHFHFRKGFNVDRSDRIVMERTAHYAWHILDNIINGRGDDVR